MARISTYSQDTSISVDDLLIGTDAEDSNITKNYKIGDVKDFIAGTQLVTTKVTVTSAQLLSLNGGGTIELIEAPGAGKVIVPISQALFLDFNTTAYNFDANIFLGFSGAANIATSFLNSTADKYINSSVVTSDLTVNGAFNLYSTTQTVSAGDSPITLSIAYRIVDFS